ncbi:biotin--[acetyl-CoA-carboxylase] ligase [Lysinibacter cavernae]|uniref:biotin--[biotin carboxyl-carrier protein] ligase n=1 Tax=Lysinibacter cavernae TaxID=1640652 RepID=A0A7X5TV15_9MICO|nr:biotin--[acetyl-CoA-carboxylase] ligase [Lysinibacter cavernae]NIH55118.1 BirA family biotin operon repressor/biotin-[acetyl-CoA-carboxylase] ligase [Lysinibacter cavernae]
MHLPLSTTVATNLTWLSSVGSTNSELAARAQAAAHPLRDRTVIATDNQTGGRGRLDRVWIAPSGTSLAVSVLIRPAKHNSQVSLLPLIAGSALAAAVREQLPTREVAVKWPNDVLVEGKKISGILCEIAPDGSVIVGAGLNLSMTDAQLPVPTATSLVLNGAKNPQVDTVLASYLGHLFSLTDELFASTPSGSAPTLNRVRADSATLGTAVTAHLPGGSSVTGEAIDLDGDGHLIVRSGVDGSSVTVVAGDIIHLRPATQNE